MRFYLSHSGINSDCLLARVDSAWVSVRLGAGASSPEAVDAAGNRGESGVPVTPLETRATALPMRAQPWVSVQDQFWGSELPSFCLVLALHVFTRDLKLRQMGVAVDRSWSGLLADCTDVAAMTIKKNERAKHTPFQSGHSGDQLITGDGGDYWKRPHVLTRSGELVMLEFENDRQRATQAAKRERQQGGGSDGAADQAAAAAADDDDDMNGGDSDEAAEQATHSSSESGSGRGRKGGGTGSVTASLVDFAMPRVKDALPSEHAGGGSSWTMEEDDSLLKGVDVHRNNWGLVCEQPGLERFSSLHCQGRYVQKSFQNAYVLAPAERLKPGTTLDASEQTALVVLMKQFPPKSSQRHQRWSEIIKYDHAQVAPTLPGRDSTGLRCAWTTAGKFETVYRGGPLRSYMEAEYAEKVQVPVGAKRSAAVAAEGEDVQTYLSKRGLDAWTSHLMDAMQVTSPADARAITKEDLQRSWNTPIAEPTLIDVLERLGRKIDPDGEASTGSTRAKVV